MMQTQHDTLGRWLRDVAVTIVLLFVAIALADAAAMRIAPQSMFVYIACLIVALIPTHRWLRQCGVSLLADRFETAAFTLLILASGLIVDLAPNAWGMKWELCLVGMCLLRPVVQRLIEKISVREDRNA